jgi:peptidoglycan/xylan/chitin deacetylase (PgdA/CDA1 family)
MTPEFHVFDVLQRHGVPFVVVGGHAVNFHGFIRATEDTTCYGSGRPSPRRAC